MLLKLIACNVFQREAFLCAARSPHVIDVEFSEVGEHVHPAQLRESIQARIDAASSCAKSYEAILLLYGLCGGAAPGLVARNVPLVMPRAHDCCTILLGSRERFQEHFGDDPSTPFGSTGYLERGNYLLHAGDGGVGIRYGDGYAQLVEQYGEEAAVYIWETMNPQRHLDTPGRAVFIDIPETAGLGHAEQFQRSAEEHGRQYLRLEGNLRLIDGLLNGPWPKDEYLLIPPGHRVAGVYDWTEIIRAEPGE